MLVIFRCVVEYLLDAFKKQNFFVWILSVYISKITVGKGLHADNSGNIFPVTFECNFSFSINRFSILIALPLFFPVDDIDVDVDGDGDSGNSTNHSPDDGQKNLLTTSTTEGWHNFFTLLEQLSRPSDLFDLITCSLVSLQVEVTLFRDASVVGRL